jgi:type IV pilus assembly protein PilQ
LFVIDMTGVSGTPSPGSQVVESPLVDSYRLLSYRGADDQPHLALELTLKEEGQIQIEELGEGLEVRVEKLSSGPAHAKPAPAVSATASSEPKVDKKVPAATPAMSAAPAPRTSVKEITVALAETGAGLEVEILGDGAMQYRTMELHKPDRLVLDIQNAINRIRQRSLDVNTPPLKTVRVAQFSREPAITRVVMDLNSKVPYEVRSHASGLLVSLGGSEPHASASGPEASPAMASQTFPNLPDASEVEGSAAEETPAGDSAGEPDSDVAEAEVVSLPEPAAQTVEEPAVEVSASLNRETFQSEEPVLVASSEPSTIPFPKIEAAAVPAPPVVASLEPAAAAPAAIPPMAEAAEPVVAQTRSEPTPAPRATVLMAQAGGAPLGAQLAGAQRPVYSGEPISVNLKDVDLDDFFRLIHEISGLNIVLDPNVAGTVTIVLDEVPWDQAMDIVMRNNGLAEGERIGNVVRIARVSTLEAEAKAQLARAQAEAQAIEQSQPRQTVTRVLSYAQAEGLVPTLKRFLSARGDLTFDARTNMLIITDIAPAIGEIDRLLGTLDQKSQQVEIEARIVAASRSFARDIGSQLAASGQSGRVVLGGTGLVGTSPILRGETPPLFIGTPPTPPAPGEPPIFASVAQPLVTNLAAVDRFGGVSFLISTPTFALDAILTAAESRGLGKLLSRPKIITQSNVEAIVQQGVRIPIQTSINNTITTQYINVVLRLTVTPQITAEGTVFLRADIENTGINPGIARINGVPALNTQQATTQVLVSNGGTVFFGGVIQTENNLTEQQVPLLGSIPLVGNLFKRRATSSSTNELLFFITPRIVQS